IEYPHKIFYCHNSYNRINFNLFLSFRGFLSNSTSVFDAILVFVVVRIDFLVKFQRKRSGLFKKL
ncbi:MAG: hypothetical protein AAF600_00865, partial [Bacteroidota bacterium]